MSVMGASDALHSVGIEWEQIVQKVRPDQVSVYSSSLMSQLDQNGYGGMMSARLNGKRVSSKQLSLGFNSMPADFTNAYVLGSVGSTGAVAGACATFLYNLRWAVEEIRRGQTKVAVVGCSEAPIIPEVIDGYAAMSALATDDDLRKLDGIGEPNYRRASRPFADNCGFTLAESTQYIVLMSDDLALEMGAEIYGAVPGVYVNADGYKKSISSPGAGNYLTMAKAVSLASSLLGESVVQRSSFVQAHGSSTPANRVTESKIFHEVAEAFGISNWPIAAVKSYLGHSLGPASGDQMSATLGVFSRGLIPGIKTIDKVAEDVYSQNLCIRNEDIEVDDVKVGFLNSKGFGGNNATAAVFSPSAINRFIEGRYSQAEIRDYRAKKEGVLQRRDQYLSEADSGELKPRYLFGTNMIDEESINISKKEIVIPGFDKSLQLGGTEGLEGF
jgi:acetoacetyl-[acyl-carrier protein] synthase